jgi:hypothetical protein
MAVVQRFVWSVGIYTCTFFPALSRNCFQAQLGIYCDSFYLNLHFKLTRFSLSIPMQKGVRWWVERSLFFTNKATQSFLLHF